MSAAVSPSTDMLAVLCGHVAEGVDPVQCRIGRDRDRLIVSRGSYRLRCLRRV